MKEKFLKFLTETQTIFPHIQLDELGNDFQQLLDTIEGQSFIKTLNKKSKGKFKDGFSYRTLNYWEQEGIIPEDRDKEGNWRNYSILDQVWLGIVISLRAFGMKSQAILKVRSYLNHLSVEYNSLYPLLVLYQAKSITEHYSPFYLLVLDNGVCQLALKREFKIQLEVTDVFEDFLTIDVSVMFRNITETQLKLNKIDKEDFKVISGKYLEIHNEIIDEQNSKVTVNRDEQGNLVTIESEKKYDPKTLNGVATKGVEYGKITSQIVNGKVVAKTIFKKKKL